MAKLYLVRHAKAGERRTWVGDDRLRPLSKKGWKQSEALAVRLAKLDPPLLASSEYVRCIQTLEPLAKRLRTKVKVDGRLTEDEPVEPLLDLLHYAPPNSVLCSHGDLIPAVIQLLCKNGTKLKSQPDWRKSAVWVLHRNRHSDFVSATAWPPPRL